ncbi:endonuclease III domain-containing protein [Alkalibacterium sp. 20]|uniref:endonuclease III domain-containing protein n=1 Tax=Alkalibacterium sp. 20 TaxID=1798803 RepID=UPI0009003D6C|nr:DNA repair protein [Alkalibacterium sp. 20]OJF94582.1 DNA repair protein [Alkalibacterium sp. 20]
MSTDREKVKVLNKLVAHYGIQNWWSDENRIKDWVSMILIQQTTQENVEKVLKNLDPYLTVDQLHKMEDEKLQLLIRPAGFYKQKSAYIKVLMTWFVSHGEEFEKFESYSDETLRKELLSIKGVGPETADAMLLYIFNRNVFIGDQYAIRLFKRLGFGEFKNLGHMRREFNHLTELVPVELCKEWHAAIDEHGKVFRKNKNVDETWLLP